MVACKNWNDLPAVPEEFHGTVQSHEKVNAHTWNIITYNEHETSDGNFEWLFRHQSCLHCVEAACEKACPENAISHTKFGSVVIDSDICVGCGYCVQNCTFDIVELATYKDKNGKKYRKAQKCDLCTGRLEQGLKPACVTSCHANALIYDEKEKVLAEAKKRLEVVKERFPNANIYNPQGIKGTTMVYLLADKPSVYGLPEDPQVPLSQIVWKDIAQPVGKFMFGAVGMAVIGSAVAKAITKEKGDQEGGHGHE
jgi:formate dehydrogenase iron-sulfur subunit